MALKEEIVYLLEKNRGRFVSGEEIAAGRDITRSAVWKCVNSLKSEGYEVISANNAGYMLAPESDILSSPAIRANLPGEYAQSAEIYTFKTLDSTNNEAKRMNANGAPGGDLIIAADGQTAGRGRRGKSFYSPAKEGVYFSFLFRTEKSLADATAVTTAAAVAVAETLAEYSAVKPLIKWVNDVYVDGKKVCGILSEAVSDFESGAVQAVIVGIGINLVTSDFPQELQKTAGNIGANGFVNRAALIAKIYVRLKALFEALPDRGYMQTYRALSAVTGKEITFERNGAQCSALALDITGDGGLVCRLPDGSETTLRSGEVSIKIK